MKRMLWVCLLVFGLILSWTLVYAEDFYVIPVQKCCTCKGTLYENRWCDNGDGTVTDLTTCLVWLKKAAWGGQKDWRQEGDWNHNDDANTRAGILRAADYAWLTDGSVEGDWRLPTKSELTGLINGTPNLRCVSGPCNLYAFTGVQSPYYWSSSTNVSNTRSAWCVYLSDGLVTTNSKTNSYYVWPVRGGQ